MRRRIAVIIAAAALAWSGLLAAQGPETGKRPAGRSETPAAPRPGTGPSPQIAPTQRAAPAQRAAPVVTTPVSRPPPVQAELVEKAAKDSIRSLDLQTELTAPEADKPSSHPINISPIRIPQEALWIVLILAAAVLLFALREELMNLIRPAQTGWEPPAPGAGEVEVSSEADALSSADRLSREGNFVEAMHVLLLHSLAEIRRQLGEQFADSLTSREIVRVARLTMAARGALRDIVGVVERTYFGAYPAAAGDYATCRQNFETLQQALRGGAPA
jgi:hypothetical protein